MKKASVLRWRKKEGRKGKKEVRKEGNRLKQAMCVALEHTTKSSEPSGLALVVQS